MNYFLSKMVKLTKREEECLMLAAHGLTDEMIAIKLFIEPCTVHKHLRNARRKLGAKDTTNAVALWLSTFHILLLDTFIN